MATKAPAKIPVLMDTREQKGWGPELNADLFTVERGTLHTGDYSFPGLRDWEYVIERKSLGDFVGSVIQDWTRFLKELNRLKLFNSACVVVEATVEDVLARRYESEANPLSVWGKVLTIRERFKIGVEFWGPRAVCIAAVERELLFMHNELTVRGAF